MPAVDRLKNIFAGVTGKKLQIAKLKSKIPSNRTHAIVILLLLVMVGGLIAEIIQVRNQSTQFTRSLEDEVKQLESVITGERTANESIAVELSKLQNSEPQEKLEEIEETIDAYLFSQQKLIDYESQGIDIKEPEQKLGNALEKIFGRNYEEARSTLNEINVLLEKLLEDRLASIAEQEAKQHAAQAAQLPTSVPGLGSGRISVSTSKGSFLIDLVKIDLNGVRVITDSANENDCSDNCPTKSLAQYIAESGGFAGINGTYFCPQDYSTCAGKVNSFDFGLFNTRQSRWINGTTLFWNGRTMIAFDGGSNPYFFKDANSFGGVGDLKAAIVNYPALVSGGQNVLGNGDSLNDYLKVTRSTRSGLGIKGKVAYLVVARGASVPDLAEIFMSLGVDHAMNLDGGGSSALYYNGRYLAGPGRSLPNAVIFAR